MILVQDGQCRILNDVIAYHRGDGVSWERGSIRSLCNSHRVTSYVQLMEIVDRDNTPLLKKMGSEIDP